MRAAFLLSWSSWWSLSSSSSSSSSLSSSSSESDRDWQKFVGNLCHQEVWLGFQLRTHNSKSLSHLVCWPVCPSRNAKIIQKGIKLALLPLPNVHDWCCRVNGLVNPPIVSPMSNNCMPMVHYLHAFSFNYRKWYRSSENANGVMTVGTAFPHKILPRPKKSHNCQQSSFI